MSKREGLRGQCLTLFLPIKKISVWLALWLIMNIFPVVLFLISWRWKSGMYKWENSLWCLLTPVYMWQGQLPGMAATSVCVPRVSQSHSLPLWETLQGKQSVLKLDFSLGFTPLFHLELILVTEHWAYAGANLLVAGKSFAWFASGNFTKCQKWKHRLQILLPALLLNDSSSLTFPCMWRAWIYLVYLWWPQ